MNKVQKEHHHIFANFKESFKNFLTLVVMQLKEQLSFSFKADKKGTITKLILFGVLFVAVTATIAVVIYLLGYLRILGNGEIKKAVTVKASYFSPSAKEKIEKAGGKAELV